MFNFLKKRKFKRLYRNLVNFGVVDEDNWSEFKALHIRTMTLACQLDFGSCREWAQVQALETIKRYRGFYLEYMPFDYYTDLFVTLREEVKPLLPLVEQIKSLSTKVGSR